MMMMYIENSPDGIPKIVDSVNLTATTNIITANSAAKRINPLIPSRYNTKNSDRYTNAEPVSRCINIKNMGMKIIVKTFKKFDGLPLNVKLYSLNILAKASAVANLANSAGCRLIGPSTIQE